MSSNNEAQTERNHRGAWFMLIVNVLMRAGAVAFCVLTIRAVAQAVAPVWLNRALVGWVVWLVGGIVIFGYFRCSRTKRVC
jgi:hypothetical protein